MYNAVRKLPLASPMYSYYLKDWSMHMSIFISAGDNCHPLLVPALSLPQQHHLLSHNPIKPA